jgi:hypothetical protein
MVKSCALPEDGSLARIIRGAIAEAREAGIDDLGATQRATQAILSVRPDMTPREAMRLVERVRE